MISNKVSPFLFCIFFSQSASAILVVSVNNFGLAPGGGVVGSPFVDEDGILLPQSEFSVKVGTFEPSFISSLGGLNPRTESDSVRLAFIEGATVATNVLDGLVNAQVEFQYLPGIGVEEGDGVFFLVNYDPPVGDSVSLVLDLGSTYPPLDGLGNGSFFLGRPVDAGDVIWGGRAKSGVDTSSLPDALQTPAFSQGIEIGVPEPSTGLFSLLGLAIIFRRNR